MTKFHIKNTFHISISGTRSIILEGTIIRGVVKVGQKIKLKSTNNHPAIELTISGVEFIDHASKKTANIGLLVKIENSNELTGLLNYGIKDETCEIL